MTRTTATRKTESARVTREIHARGLHVGHRAERTCVDCRAAQLLRAARAILVEERYPFPVLEAGRRLGMQRGSEEWRIADEARDLAHRDRTELGLSCAAALVEEGVVAKRDLVVELYEIGPTSEEGPIGGPAKRRSSRPDERKQTSAGSRTKGRKR